MIDLQIRSHYGDFSAYETLEVLGLSESVEHLKPHLLERCSLNRVCAEKIKETKTAGTPGSLRIRETSQAPFCWNPVQPRMCGKMKETKNAGTAGSLRIRGTHMPPLLQTFFNRVCAGK